MPVLSRVIAGGRDERIPDPLDCGQVLITMDGRTWEAQKPVVGLDKGWLSNAQGDLLVEGWLPNG